MPSILDSLGSGVLDAPKPKPVEFRTIDDPVSTRRLLYNNVLDGVRNMAPISNQVFTLKLKDADYADPEEFTLKQQKEALLGGKTLSRRLRGTFQLIDNKDNKIVDEKKITIAEVPHLTDRGVFVLNGSDWSLASQLRLLPGVFTRVKGDGTAESHCFHKAVKVHTEIGLIPIGRLVNERMRVRVWSYDLIEKKFVLKRITNWFQNRITGPTRRERLGRLVFDSLATTPTLLPAHKATRIWATPTHKAIRADGSKEEFRTARTVLQVEEKPSAWQEQIILGSILGDGNITASGILNEAHGLEQSDYLRFKAEILGQLLSQPLYERCVYENDGRVRRSIWLHTKAWSYLKRLHGAVYRRRGGKNIPHSLLSRLDPRGLAVFFCDDGCHLRTENSTHITTHLELSFAMHDFSTKSVERFRKHLLDKYGLESKQTRARRYLGTDVGWYTLLSGDHAEKFMDLLAPYIPTCMRYKLGERPPTGQCTGCGKEVDRRRKRCNKCCLEHYTQDRENSTAAKRFGGRTVVDAILESGVVPPESNLGETWDARLASLGAGISLCEEDRRTVLGTLEIPCKFDPYLNRPAKDKNDRYAYDIEVEGTHNYLANGILVSNCNIMPGKGISSRINLDPAKNIFKLSIGQSEIPLMPLLKAMGVPDKKLQEDWGMKIWSDNAKYDDDKTLDKLYKKVLGYRAAGDANIQQKRTELAAAMRAMPVDPEVTKITLGQPYTHLDSDTILTAAKKVLQVSRGEAEVDDRDNMSYQTVMGPEDLFGERARVLDRILRPLLWKATFRRNLSPLTSGVGTRSVAGAITDSGLGQSIEESSPLDVYDQMTRVTRLGRGGIEDKDSIPSESRSVQPSHFGYIDPIRTPEALSAGVDLRFASGSMKGSDGKLYAKFTDARTGEQKLLNPQQVQKLAIAFPGEMKSSSKYATALRDGKIQYVRKDQVDLLAPPMEDAFNGLANLIAGKSATKPQRMMMGSRMYTQALPLEKPESPWVQSGKPGAEDRSYEDDFAEKVGARFSKDAGRVVAVDDDEIQVKTADGKIVKHELYNNFPLNRRTLIRSTPVVSVGQEVQPGMMLAKSNYTDDRGSLAVGTNLKVGYIAEGSVAKDTHVLWYDGNGQPVFGEVQRVETLRGVSTLATDPDSLQTAVLSMYGFIAHHADKILRIQTSSGRILRATAEHSFVVLGDNGRLREKRGDELIPGVDLIPRLGAINLPVTVRQVHTETCRGNDSFHTFPLDYDFGFLCGLYAAEGYRNGSTVAIAALNKEIRNKVVSLAAKYLPNATVNTRNVEFVLIYDARTIDFLEKHCGKLAANKKVPDFVFGSPEECRRGFVAGYWTGDGRVGTSNGKPKDTDTFTTSRRLRDGLGLLLASLGISTTHGEEEGRQENWNKQYRLGVSMRDMHKLPSILCSDKNHRLTGLKNSYKDTGTADHIPIPSEFREAVRKLTWQGGLTKNEKNRIRDRAAKGTMSRRDVLAFVPENSDSAILQRLRYIALQPVEWDVIESVTTTDYDDWVFDFDMRPLKTFVCLDTLVVHNSSHEDAAVLSESGARKLTSEHLFQNTLDLDDKLRMGKRSYISLYPASYDRKTLEAMDDDGVIKPGEVVQYGQPLILAAKEKERAHNQITRGKDSSFSDHSVTWEHHDPGVVTDVVKTDKGINVSVRGYMPFQVGDKIAGRLGDKSVISKIIPDEQMPRGEDGKPLDLIVNPLGVVTRTNPSQVTEAVLGKIAALRGTPYKLKDFDDISDLNQYAIDEAKKHGVKAMETLTDPMTGRKIPDILVGQRFIMKLHHMSEHKSQGRSIGGYTQNDEPAKGGGDGDSSKRMALMDLNALLSHGALTMARNNHLLRGTKRLDWWAATMAGLNPPEPEIPFINQKYFESLKAAGINPLNQSGRLRFMALTDKDVDTLAENRNLQNSDTVDWDNGLKPNPGGLFDPGMTGSHGGRRWSAIPLHEPMINPVMEDPVRKVLGLTTKRFDAILEGKEQLNGLSGPIALQRALEDVNLDTEIARARGEIASGKKTKRSDAIKRLQLLRRTQELKMHPKDWVLKRVPVLPPAFRPVSVMQGNKMPMIADANALYRDLFEANQNLKQMSQISDDTSNERRAVYEAFRAVVGLGDPITPKNQERKVKGILRQVLGSNPKHSMLQRKLLGSAVDMVGRAVIIPDPTLDIDEAGIPENKAWEIYRPFIIRRLVRHGMTPIMAADRVKDRDPLARKMMLTEMEARPIVATRAPVLHRYGVMGFWPRLVKHNALSLPPSTWKGLGADADGNCCDYDTELNLIFNKTALQSDPEFLQALETTVMRLCGNQLVDLYDGDGQAYLTLKIGDFPRVGEPRIDKNGASIYRVPKGVSVLTVETGRGSFFSPVTSLTVEENCRTVEVRTDSGHSVIVSDNESLAVFNETTLRFDKCKPEESINKWLPIAKSAGKFGNQFSRDLGWWYGAFVSDGWVSERYTGYAKEDPRMRQEFLRILRAEICDNFSYNEYEEKPEKGKNKHGHSVKMHLWSPVLQSRIFNCYGLPRSEWGEARGSLFKKIPDEILQHGSEECLLGLLAGLLEGDGSLYWNNTKGMNRRPNTRVSTSSSYLITTLKKLLHRFGVAWSVTETPPREGANTHVAYNLTMSVPDVVALLPRLKFLLPETRKIAKEFTQHGITKPDEDYMPAPTAMLAVFKKVTLRAKTREGNTLYSAISKFGKRGEITRYSALRLLNEFLPAARAMAPELPWEGYQKLYNDRDILWTRVKSSTESGQRQVFDLAIPETKVFAVNDGLVIYDTMNYHVPVTDEEVQEVIDKMLPSKNLFSTKTFKVHQLPQNEYAGGLYVGSTRVDKDSPEEVFQTAADAMKAFREGRINADRRVVIVNQ